MTDTIDQHLRELQKARLRETQMRDPRFWPPKINPKDMKTGRLAIISPRLDAINSYHAAIEEIKRRVTNKEPLSPLYEELFKPRE
jgi:hypothetical protein